MGQAQRNAEPRCWWLPLGIAADGHKPPLALVEGATENAAVVQALIDKSHHARARPQGLPPVHRRWRQGTEQSHPPQLRRTQLNPALSDPQGKATLSSGCRNRCMHQSAARFGKPGTSTMPTRPSDCSAISHAGSSRRRPLLPPASLKGSQGSESGLMGQVSEDCREVIRVPSGAFSLEPDASLVVDGSHEIDGELCDDGHIFCAVPGSQT